MNDTLLAEPTFFHRIEKCMHQIISIILWNLKWLLLDVIVQILDIMSKQTDQYQSVQTNCKLQIYNSHFTRFPQVPTCT